MKLQLISASLDGIWTTLQCLILFNSRNSAVNFHCTLTEEDGETQQEVKGKAQCDRHVSTPGWNTGYRF